jgi:MFS family permease
LNLTGNKYNISLTVFYILYVLIDIPSNWLLKVVGGGKYLPMLALAWGIVGTCMGAVKSYGGLIACRLLLGACEGGMFGGIILYLSMFYKRHQLMFRLGVSTASFKRKEQRVDFIAGLLLRRSSQRCIWWSLGDRPS